MRARRVRGCYIPVERARHVSQRAQPEEVYEVLENGEFKPLWVRTRSFGKSAAYSVRFDIGDMVKLGRAARRLGTGRSTLVRAIVKQCLNNNNGEEACVSDGGRGYMAFARKLPNSSRGRG